MGEARRAPTSEALTACPDTLSGMRGKSPAAGASATKQAKNEAPNETGGRRRRSGVGSVLSLLGAFIATAMALGLLFAGLLIPATGLAGAAVKGGVKEFDDMPGTLAENALSQQSKILAKDGSVIATPYDENRVVVPSSAIPKVMKDAQVAIEDERFYEHGALDQRGIARAVAANLVSSGTQGASTLTQQYVKVAAQREALESGNKEEAKKAVAQHGTDAYVRKIKQLKMAVELEKTHTKDQILTSYLNLVYFGDGAYGIEAAARHYFGHPAKDLTLAEAATLAGVVNLPDSTNPVRNPKDAVTRRNIVLQKMIDQGRVSKAEGDQAIASPLRTHVTNVAGGGGCQGSKYPYFCDYVTDWVAEQPALGANRKERLGKLRTGGLTIRTSLDPKKMAALDSNLKKRVPTGNGADVQAAGVIVEPGTGLVEAMAQNSKYDVAGSNHFSTSVDWARSGFPIGSTAKIFAIVEAMRQGRAVDSTVNVPAMNALKNGRAVYNFTSKTFPGECGQRKGAWSVGNDHPVAPGPMSLSKATAESVNTAFGALVASLGPCKVHDTFGLMGVQARDLTTGGWRDIRRDPSSIVLGSDSSSPMMMANAFATVAADGKYCTPRPVVSIKQANGKPVALSVPPCKQVISQQQARGTSKIFTHVFDSDGTASDAKLAEGREAFGKTGTVDGSLHTWFVGSTKQLSTAIWVGRGFDNKNAIRNVSIGGKYIGTFLYGGDIAAPVWKDTMDAVSEGMPKVKLPQPDKATTQGATISVPDVKGKSEADAKSMLEKAGFLVTVTKQNANGVSRGQAFKTSPAAGQKLGKGKKITLYVKS